jgi:NitT/TauT family transport system permease protein
MADAAASAPVIAAKPERSWLSNLASNLFPFIVLLGLWEIMAHSGLLPKRLFPSLEEIAATFVRLIVEGILPRHVGETVLRLVGGFGIAAVFGVVIGILMGRFRFAEDTMLPVVAALAPIPGLAYAPLFMMWFGISSWTVILMVAFVSSFSIIFNTWTGVKAVMEIWVRSAQSMGASDMAMFRKVILPGALPYIMTGLRLGMAQAWRALVGLEMLAAVPWGLGWMIFGATKFLNTDVMMAGVFVIAILGLIIEKLVFQKLEEKTVVRWGMMRS